MFTVYAPDHRGHGRTNNPDGKFSSFGALAWDMIGFVEALKLSQKPVVMGHSSGAMISLYMSIYQPDMIVRQVLISIHPFLGVSEHWKCGTEKFFNTGDFRKPPDKWTFILKQPRNAIVLWWVHRATPWFKLLHQAWAMWGRPSELELSDYKKISIPSMVLMGTKDEFGSVDEAKELAARIKGAKFCEVPGADHMFVVDHPEWLQERVLPFLKEGKVVQLTGIS